LKVLYLIGGIIAVSAVLAVGLFIAKGPQPEIVVPAEVLTTVGFLNITNTLLTSWVVMAVIIIMAFVCTRSLKLIPGSAQNFFEGVLQFLMDQVEDIAGATNGRKFFMVVATIFLWVICNNWFGLLPFFNAIGKTEDVNHHIFETIHEQDEKGVPFADGESQGYWVMESSGNWTIAKPQAEAGELEIEANDTAGQATDRYIVMLAVQFTDFEAPESTAPPSVETVQGAMAALNADPLAPKVHLVEATAEGEAAGHGEESAEGEHHTIPSEALHAEVEAVTFPGETIGLIIPFFRSTFSDVNNTLAMGIVAFIFIEFWGLQALGVGYLSKFFNLKGIMSFVGILELLSEFIRIISFTFRLFGNIFAGEVLILMLTFLMPFLLVDVIYGLELFVGFIQAAVFALLTLVFATMAVEHHDEEEHHEGHHDEDGTADAHHHPGTAQAH